MQAWIPIKTKITGGEFCPVYFNNVYVIERRKFLGQWFIGFFGKII